MISKHVSRLGLALEELARTEAERGHTHTALELYAEAANNFTQAQNALFENNLEKRTIHARLLQCDEQVRRLAPYRIERMEVAWDDGVVAANFHVLPGDSPAPCIVFIPGCDATKEGFPHPLYNHAHQRRMHMVSVDGPGQGESNIAGVRLTADNFGVAMRAVFDAVAGRDDVIDTQIVVFGFSFGALWAVQSAAAESRFAACAAPMTTVSLANMFNETPWREPQFRYLTGAESQEELDEIAERMTIRSVVSDVQCPTLFSVGEYDPRSPLDEVLELYDSMSCDRELWIFEDQHHLTSMSGRTGAGMRGTGVGDFFSAALDWLRDRIVGIPIERSGDVRYIRNGGLGPYGATTTAARSWIEAYGLVRS
jgi:pimeloyl-ACP methyl ester carboxylesterase